MPLIRNQNGKIVCVTMDEARFHLENTPRKVNYDGKVIQKGFTVIEDQDAAREEYLAEVRAAAEAHAEREAAELVAREQGGMAMAKGLAKAFGLDKPGGKKAKKDD